MGSPIQLECHLEFIQDNLSQLKPKSKPFESNNLTHFRYLSGSHIWPGPVPVSPEYKITFLRLSLYDDIVECNTIDFINFNSCVAFCLKIDWSLFFEISRRVSSNEKMTPKDPA